MSVRWYTVVVDCRDVKAQAYWWANVLGWEIGYEADDEVVVVPAHLMDSRLPLHERGQGLVFVPVPEPKTVKNRLHIDLAPGPDDDQAAEVSRLKALGARPIHLGQRADATFVVLADPEGNEFCVLSARD